MIKSILDVYVEKAGVESGILSAYYDLSGSVTGPDESSFFKLTSGATNALDTHVVYNQLFSTSSQLPLDEEDNPLLSTDNYPAVITSTSTASTGSGHFDGQSSLKISRPFSGENWTCFFDFSGYDIDNDTFGLNQVIFSTMSNPSSLSGFNVGVNGSNRFYYEYISGREGTNDHRVSEALPVHLKSLNLISLAKNEDSIEFSLHKPSEETSSLKNFTDNFSRSNDMYIGGMSNGGSYSHFYTGYSGFINTFLLFNEYITESSRNTIAESFFTTGYEAAGLVTGESINKEVTGVVLQNVLSGQGVTSYSLMQDGSYFNEAGQEVPIYAQKGVQGNIYQDVLVDLTGDANIVSITGYYSPSTNTRDENYVNKSNTVPGKIKFDEPLLGGDTYEIYSHYSWLNTINHRTEKNLFSFGDFGTTPDNIGVFGVEAKNNNFSYDPATTQPFIQFFLNGVYRNETSGLYSVSDVFSNNFSNVGVEGASAVYKGDYFIHDNDAGTYGTKNIGSRIENNSYYITLNENDSELNSDDFGLFDIVSGAALTGEWDPGVSPHPKFKAEDGYLDKDVYYNGMKLLSGVHYTHDTQNPQGILSLNSEILKHLGLQGENPVRFNFVPQASTTFSRVTGQPTIETSEIDVDNVYFEQVWRNGIRQIPGVNYLRSPLDSLISGVDSPSHVNGSFDFNFTNAAIDVTIDEQRENSNTKLFSFNKAQQKANLFETVS
jgi:hypothetical protein